MYTDTDGIVMRQVKTVDGRQMLVLFSRKYGKISAGTSISQRGKNKSTLAIRPFTYSKYEMYKNRDRYNINGAEVIKSFYKIGEDVEKFIIASYILEFTDKLLPEDEPNERIFDLLIEFLSLLEVRKSKFETLSVAYQLKAYVYLGVAPNLEECAICGSKEDLDFFSVADGGLICKNCSKNKQINEKVGLIYSVNFGIVDVLRCFTKKQLADFKNIGLNDDIQDDISEITEKYAEYHFDIKGLKSKGIM